MHYWEIIKSKKSTPYLISVVFFLLFWFFRSAVFDGGSSDIWTREIEDNVWFRKRRMLSFFLMQLTYRIMNFINHWNGRLVINLVSCITGAVFVFFLYRVCQRWQRGWIPFMLVMTSGMAVLFYGHIETYPQSVAATMIFLYTLLEYLQGRLRAIYPAAAYSFAAMFHLQIGFLFPILPFAWYISGKKKAELKDFMVGLSPIVLLWIAVSYFSVGEGDLWANLLFEIPFVGLVGGGPEFDHTYTFFTKKHLFDWVWFQYRIAWVALPTIFILGLFNKIDWRDKIVQTLAVGSLCLLIFASISYPFNGTKTWDVLAITGLPTTLLAGYLLTKLRFAKLICIPLIMISLAISIPWIVPRAKLGHRGEGTILIQNAPKSAIIILDGYLQHQPNIYHVLEGDHNLKIIVPPNKVKQDFQVKPKQTVVIQYQPNTNNKER
jgi:hypothetical protein